MLNWTESATLEQILSSNFLLRHSDGNSFLANLKKEYDYKWIVSCYVFLQKKLIQNGLINFNLF
jgi:hypothetical protein